MPDESKLTKVIAELRHLYANLVHVVHTKDGAKRVAIGLLGPQIHILEKFHREWVQAINDEGTK